MAMVRGRIDSWGTTSSVGSGGQHLLFPPREVDTCMQRTWGKILNNANSAKTYPINPTRCMIQLLVPLKDTGRVYLIYRGRKPWHTPTRQSVRRSRSRAAKTMSPPPLHFRRKYSRAFIQNGRLHELLHDKCTKGLLTVYLREI